MILYKYYFELTFKLSAACDSDNCIFNGI